MPTVSDLDLLREAIAAAKAGNKAVARALLLQAAELHPDNESVWFWLAYVADNPGDVRSYLRRVLQINPTQEPARSVLKKALLQEGVAAAKAGDKGQARQILLEVSELDPHNETVWLWLASVAEMPNDEAVYLQKVLQINPANERAIAWLSKTPSLAAPSAPSWECPLCGAPAAAPVDTCPKCRAILTLNNIDALMENRKVDHQLVQGAIHRYENIPKDRADFNVHFNLGLAFLNLKRLAEGSARLKTASELRPEDDALRSQVEALLRRQNTAAVAAKAKEKKEQLKQKVILLVDDSPTVRKLVAVTLERQGHRVVTASSALEALAKLNELVPDLILLDIVMPQMDGYQLCKIIKESNMTKHVPVVMLSGKTGFFDKVRGRMMGAVDYLTKPFDPAELLDAVDKYCKRRGEA